MKKQYIFLFMIILIFYISYNIITLTIREHKVNKDIEYIKFLTLEMEEKIEITKKIIEYKSSKAYKNKILKEQQSFKNFGEDVIYFTTEENFNKYTMETEPKKEEIIIPKDKFEIIKDLSIYEKWKFFLFRIYDEK